MSDPLGYVVIEYNQASRLPDLPAAPVLHRDRDGADVERAALEGETRTVGRGETYAVAEVHLIDEEETDHG